MIVNSNAGVKYLFDEYLKKCIEGYAFNENNQLIVSKESVEKYLKLFEQNKANDYFKTLHVLVK